MIHILSEWINREHIVKHAAPSRIATLNTQLTACSQCKPRQSRGQNQIETFFDISAYSNHFGSISNSSETY